MKYPPLRTLALIAAIFAAPTVADAEPPAGQNHLEPLAWIIGNWAWQWNTNQEVPGIARSGDQISGQMACQWDLDGHAIDMRLSLTTSDNSKWTVRTLIGWDPATKTLISRSFDSKGGHGSGSFVKQGDQWLLRTLAINADGEELANALLFSDIQSDSFSLQGTNRQAGSDAVSFGPKTRFQRK